MRKQILLGAATCLLFSVEVRADFQESGSLSVSGSLQASSLSVTAAGAGVFALTVSSGIHLTGGKVQLGPGTFLQWPDGTTSNSAIAVPPLRSTWTLSESEFSTTVSTWVSVPGSSIAMTMSGGQALVGYSCPMSSFTAIGLLVNGALIDSQHNPSAGSYGGLNAAFSSSIEPGGFVHLTTGTYSGNTSFSLVFQGADGFLARINPSSGAVCQFFALEL